MPLSNDPIKREAALNVLRTTNFGRSPVNKGKTNKEMFGEERAKQISLLISTATKGRPNPRKGVRTGLGRDSASYIEWKNKVYLRDSNTCRRCGKQGLTKRDKHAHHIIPWEVVELRFDVSNGVTLCMSCHKKDHSEIERIGLLLVRLFESKTPEVLRFLLQNLSSLNPDELIKSTESYLDRINKWKNENNTLK